MGRHWTLEAHSPSCPSHPSWFCFPETEWVQSGEATNSQSHSSEQYSEDGNRAGSLLETWAACLLWLRPPYPTHEGGKYNSGQRALIPLGILMFSTVREGLGWNPKGLTV